MKIGYWIKFAIEFEYQKKIINGLLTGCILIGHSMNN